MTDSIKLFIVDDHQILIDGIKSLLRNEKRFEVVGFALSAREALDKLGDTKTDILITDISMPEMDGVELSQRVKVKFPEVKILVLTMYNNQELAHEIIMNEAEGMILKNTGKKELIAALDAIADHGTYFSQEVLSNVMQKIKTEKKTAEVKAKLTERELEILQLICEEYSSEQIAQKLNISKRTVDTHRQHISEKTNCKTLIGLIKFALKNNLATI